MSLDGFSMHPLCRGLNDRLAGGRIDKITQPNRYSVILSVRQPGQNFLLQLSVHPQNPSAHLLSHPLENPPEPPVFCMVLRKYLETGRIAEIRQHGLDRLILIDIDTLAAGGSIVTRTLAVELIGKYSNIILTEDHRIIDALRRIGNNNSRVRTVLPNQEYSLPPGQEKLDLFTDPVDDILLRIQSEPALSLSKALLAACMGFGPVSAREAAHRAGLPSNITVSTLDEADFASLREALLELRESCTGHPRPCLLTDTNKKLLAMAAFPLHHLEGTAISHEFPDLSTLLERADQLIGSYVLPDKDRFQKLVKNELHRASNKLEVLQQEIEDAENAEEWRIRADNLMTYQYQYQNHADAEITVADIYGEHGEKLTIPLDQRLTLVQNMQACYKKYDKLKRAQELLREQYDKCELEIRYLESIDASLLASSSLAEIAEIQHELVEGGYLHEKPRKKNNDKPARPFLFHAPDGTEILVGKNNSQNDRLTFKTASPRDLWLHAKDIPGSHVILRANGDEPQETALLLAAGLAAHFSKAQGSSNIPVDYTECRYVKKPSGAKPGFVIFTNQHTLYITPEEIDGLQPLLNNCI